MIHLKAFNESAQMPGIFEFYTCSMYIALGVLTK